MIHTTPWIPHQIRHPPIFVESPLRNDLGSLDSTLGNTDPNNPKILHIYIFTHVDDNIKGESSVRYKFLTNCPQSTLKHHITKEVRLWNCGKEISFLPSLWSFPDLLSRGRSPPSKRLLPPSLPTFSALAGS